MKRIAVIFVGCVFASFFIHACPAYTKLGYHCEFTGSTESWTEWPLGIKTEHEYQKSKLEQFVELRLPADLKHKWVSFQGTGFDIFGRPMTFAHGTPGPLFYANSYLNKWCELTSDQEKKILYEILLRGDEHEVQTATDGMWKRIEDSF